MNFRAVLSWQFELLVVLSSLAVVAHLAPEDVFTDIVA